MQTAQPKTEHEIPGSIDRCMGCGEKWKVGDKVIGVSQAPMTIIEVQSDGVSLVSMEELRAKHREWHAHCLR